MHTIDIKLKIVHTHEFSYMFQQ